MAAYEPFIMGMLTNFDALPLDRVHNMLKMFVSDPPYDKSLEQLGAYMGRLVGEEKLSLDGGTYRKRA
jgi:anaphase-promoting complex subunit 2